MEKKRIAGIIIALIFSVMLIYLLSWISGLFSYQFDALIYIYSILLIAILLFPLILLGIALTISKKPIKFNDVLNINLKFWPIPLLLITIMNYILSTKNLFLWSFIISSILLIVGLIASCIIVGKKINEGDTFTEIAINILIFDAGFFLFIGMAWWALVPMINSACC